MKKSIFLRVVNSAIKEVHMSKSRLDTYLYNSLKYEKDGNTMNQAYYQMDMAEKNLKKLLKRVTNNPNILKQ